MKKNPHTQLENRIMVCKEYAQLWQRLFSYFSESLADKQVTDQMEKEFEQILSVLAINQYKFEELVGEFMPDARKILDVLSEAIDLKNIKAMSDANFGKLQLDWHTLFISMNKALGKLTGQLTPKMLAAMQARDGAQAG